MVRSGLTEQPGPIPWCFITATGFTLRWVLLSAAQTTLKGWQTFLVLWPEELPKQRKNVDMISVSWCLAMGVFNVLQICSWFQAFPYNVSADIIHTIIQALLKSIFFRFAIGCICARKPWFSWQNKRQASGTSSVQRIWHTTNLKLCLMVFSVDWPTEISRVLIHFPSIDPKSRRFGTASNVKALGSRVFRQLLNMFSWQFLPRKNPRFCQKKAKGTWHRALCGHVGQQLLKPKANLSRGETGLIPRYTRWNQTWMG